MTATSTTLNRLYTIGAYGPWAAGLISEGPGTHSWRNPRFTDLGTWRAQARTRLLERIAQPALSAPPVQTQRVIEYDGLHIEELAWQLPYGPPTRALFLKPASAPKDAPLPGVLALHCHSGMKAFGFEKITRTDAPQHPVVQTLQARGYGGRAWANELARRGYAVLVHDAFAFGSRRVRVDQVIAPFRGDPSASERVSDDITTTEGAEAYNDWASEQESVMAKALFSAGTTWPGVFSAEDRVALDILCARPDVDPARIGCAGLSGGGLRTLFLGGLDDRIRCAVCVGMLTTWRDYAVNRCHTHTWMCYVPGLPPELDYCEILGLRVPQPTLVQNNSEDALFTLPEMQRAESILTEVFAKAGAADRFACHYYPGPHKFDLAMQADAFAWLDRWLQS